MSIHDGLAVHGYGRKTASVIGRLVGQAMFGRCPLAAVAAELIPERTTAALQAWSGGLARDDRQTAFGLLGATLTPVPTLDNAVDVECEPDGHLRLSIKCAKRPNPPSPSAEFQLYVNAEGQGGIQALRSFAELAHSAWPAEIGEFYSADPYPRLGHAPVWHDPDGMLDWGRLIPLPYAERFMRLPSVAVSQDCDDVVVIRVWVGRTAAGQLQDNLGGRLFVNHFLLGNRAVERIEPNPRDNTEALELQGTSPILLELVDVDSGHRFYDRRYAPIGMDPARLVQLRRAPAGGRTVVFHGPPVPRRRLRAAYLRALDWKEARIVPGASLLEVNREPCLIVRAGPHPAIGDSTPAGDTRRALLSLLSEWRYPRYPSLTDIAKAARRVLPIAARQWIDESPTPSRPFGYSIEMQVRPEDGDRYAFPTWVVGVVPRPHAPCQEVSRLFPHAARRLAHLLGGGFRVCLEWLPAESNHE
jgi:hypothetical protein